jgi:hypothetical protein
MLSLYKLPKDLLVKLISVVKKNTDERYDTYVVIKYGGSIINVYDNEKSVKIDILNAIYDEKRFNSNAVFDIEYPPVKEMHLFEWTENCASKYSLEELINDAKNITSNSLRIIKGRFVFDYKNKFRK